MPGPLARALKRLVDSLQRGLFDEIEAMPPPSSASPSPAPDPVSITSASAPTAAGALPRHPRANRELDLDGRRVAFLLARSRRKTIGFVVGIEGLAVRAPRWVTLREVDSAVREKGGWIVARLAEQGERAARLRASRTVWREGASVAYLGASVAIVLDAQGGIAEGDVVLRDAEDGGAPARRLHIGLPSDAGEARIRDAVQSWLQREAGRLFGERVAHYAERLGVRVTRLSLSSAETRWGSANANGAVRLHWRLVQHPLATIDYVVAHELAHLREMNHGPRFWKVVESVVPDYRERRSRLKDERLAGFD